MPNKITFTGPMGPGSTITTGIFNDVTNLDLQLDKGVARIVYGTPSRVVFVSIGATTTITDSIVSGAHTIVISQ